MADNDLDDDLRLLRSLDPADPPRPQAGSETEAQALLRRIRETPRHGAGDGHALADRGSGSPSAGDHTGPSSPRGRGWRRWAVAIGRASCREGVAILECTGPDEEQGSSALCRRPKHG